MAITQPPIVGAPELAPPQERPNHNVLRYAAVGAVSLLAGASAVFLATRDGSDSDAARQQTPAEAVTPTTQAEVIPETTLVEPRVSETDPLSGDIEFTDVKPGQPFIEGTLYSGEVVKVRKLPSLDEATPVELMNAFWGLYALGLSSPPEQGGRDAIDALSTDRLVQNRILADFSSYYDDILPPSGELPETFQLGIGNPSGTPIGYEALTSAEGVTVTYVSGTVVVNPYGTASSEIAPWQAPETHGTDQWYARTLDNLSITFSTNSAGETIVSDISFLTAVKP